MIVNRRQFLDACIKKIFTIAAMTKAQTVYGNNKKITKLDMKKTAIAFDELFLKHNRIDHPENASRLNTIVTTLKQENLWSLLKFSNTKDALIQDITKVHAQGYIEEIERISNYKEDTFFNLYHEETYINQYTYQSALRAAGSAIELNLKVFDREYDNGFALLRPPGHHALNDRAMGFCIFNYDVITAYALKKYRNVKKVAIIDFDVHHGNGTESLTINDPNIMAISIHQHPFWPYTGNAQIIGQGLAKGTNVNCPLTAYAGDKEYIKLMQEIIMPKLEQFKPEHMIVFAGYDAHWQDPLAQHQVSINGFNQLTQLLLDAAKSLTNNRITFSLGGGYNPENLAASVTEGIKILLNIKSHYQEKVQPLKEKNFDKEINKLKKIHLS